MFYNAYSAYKAIFLDGKLFYRQRSLCFMILLFVTA